MRRGIVVGTAGPRRIALIGYLVIAGATLGGLWTTAFIVIGMIRVARWMAGLV